MTVSNSDQLATFLAALTRLSSETGIAIEGGVPFLMKGCDDSYGYACSEDGKLVRE